MVLPIHDNHFHCHPAGFGLEAAKKFMAAGGTSVAHVRLPSYPATVDAFVKTCEDHVAYSAKLRELGLTVWTAIGPYPLEPMKIAESKGWGEAMEFGKKCFDATRPFFEAQQAHCLGEVGRAHFDVPAELQAHNNELLQYGMEVAKDAGVPIMLHTEHTEPETMLEFAQMADNAGLARERVVKHYCGPLVQSEEHHGLMPSVIAGRSNIRKALQKDPSARFMLETDYIDDPERPNMVMPCDTVPKRTMGLHENGDLSEAQIHRMHDEIPRSLYDR